jgi:hypothetical protein
MAQGICPIGDHPFEYESKPGQHRIYCSLSHQQVASVRRQTAKRALLLTRRCSHCRQEKSRDDFSGPSTTLCKPCNAAYVRERRAINGRQDSDYAWLRHLRRYGLTGETYAELVNAQGGRCAICATTEPGGKGRWHVDHDHLCCGVRKSSCGHCIRGLLCTRCNIGIGNLRDDPKIIQAALDYITVYRARREISGPAA